MAFAPGPALFAADGQFASLKDALKSIAKTVRVLEDPVLNSAALPAWQLAAVGTVTFPSSYSGGNGVAANKITSAATVGSRAMLRVTGGGLSLAGLQPNNFTALAWTIEGLVFDADAGFDFEMGFKGASGAPIVGGVMFRQLNGEIGGAMTYIDNTGVVQRVPRIVTDAVTTNGSNVVTSATANFAAGDVGKPIGNDIRNQSPPVPLIPGATIIAVDSATQCRTSLPATIDTTAQRLAIGQHPYFRPFSTNGGGRWRKNLTVLWLPIAQFAYLIRGDQVLSEIDLSKTTLDASKTVTVETTMTTQEALAHNFQWSRTELILAHD